MTENRDSFDHRIDDDLFEVIISYLPIEDKFKYESVSKRIQRFVFNRQKVLRIDFKDIKDIDTIGYQKILTNTQMDVSKLTSLLKKLKFVTTIQIPYLLANLCEVLNTITDNCNHLNEFHLYFKGIDSNSKAFKKFFRKFCQQLKHISFGRKSNFWSVIRDIFECSPNLLSVSDIDLDLLESEFFPKQLVKINGLKLWGNETDVQFVSIQNFKKLKHLSLVLYELSEESIEFIEIISQLKSLKVLKITIKDSYHSNQTSLLIKILKTIGKSGPKLESFAFDFYTNRDLYYLDHPIRLFKSIAHFSGLKSLRFIDCRDWTTVSDLMPLNKCKNLLSLELGGVPEEGNNNIFEGIDSLVPQLRRLSVISDLLSDESLESIATLKHLTLFEIKDGKEFNISVEGLHKLEKVCPRLEIFYNFYD